MVRSALRWVFRPRVVLPVVVGGVLLMALLAMGNVHDVAAQLGRFQPRFLAAFVAVLLAYEVVRCLQWGFLLRALGIRVPPRTQVLTYVTGEVMKCLPIGNFVPDYVLRRSQGTDFGLASSVTLAINLLEVALTLLGLVVLGVPAWGWLRPLIVGGLAAFALLVWLCVRWLAWVRARSAATSALHLPARFAGHPRVRAAQEELRQFRAGGAQVLRLRVLLPAALLSATYLALGGLGLAVLAWGLGLTQVTVGQALTVYCFSLAFATVIPLPMDLGSTELGGVGVFLALGIGVGKSAAVGVMLLDRTLALGSSFALALVVGLVLQSELRAQVRSLVQAPAPATPRPCPSALEAITVTSALSASSEVSGPEPAVGLETVTMTVSLHELEDDEDTLLAGVGAQDPRVLGRGWLLWNARQDTAEETEGSEEWKETEPTQVCRVSSAPAARHYDRDGLDRHLAA